ncbi:YeeE/YedE thiosulfate transporter family protein [Paenalcaligenes hermetiae]|uniref:YeeE/YedE family protein n=1 Tax=Paenalcaligenes hermetiae TaxID=1157987 RepID=A0ABP9M732_9BURK
MPTSTVVLSSGLLIGGLFGATSQISGFCLVRGLRQRWSLQPNDQLAAFAIALAVALLGTHLVYIGQWVDITQSVYLQPTISWLLLPLGGFLFGYGMMLANSCGGRALVLFGQGNLRSLFVLLVLGISAYLTLTGVLAPLRLMLAQATSLNMPALPWQQGLMRHLSVAVLVLGLLLFAIRTPGSAHKTKALAGGIMIGLLMVAAWFVTGWLGADPFDPIPVMSLSFILPIGDTIQYSMLATGMELRFGITVVLGVILGALISALVRGQWQLQGFSTSTQMARYALGAVFMGIGGVLALGCSIGQGLGGLSTLSLSSLIACLGILLGARIGAKYPITTN